LRSSYFGRAGTAKFIGFEIDDFYYAEAQRPIAGDPDIFPLEWIRPGRLNGLKLAEHRKAP